MKIDPDIMKHANRMRATFQQFPFNNSSVFKFETGYCWLLVLIHAQDNKPIFALSHFPKDVFHTVNHTSKCKLIKSSVFVTTKSVLLTGQFETKRSFLGRGT